MSFGVFDAAVGSEIEVGLARQASVDKMAAAVYDVREKLGPILFASRDEDEFKHKIAMMKEDQSLFKVIEASGLFPLPRNVRAVVGKLSEEFRRHLADAGGGDSAMNAMGEQMVGGPAIPGPVDPTGGLLRSTLPGEQGLPPGRGAPTVPNASPSGMPSGSPLGPPPAIQPIATRRRSVYDTVDHPKWDNGTVDTNETFEGGKTDTELKPKGDFKGYLKDRSQGAQDKIKRNFVGEPVQEHTEDPAKHNFASRQQVAHYATWCKRKGLSPVRLSSLDRYVDIMPTADYFKLAAVIQAWENDYKPKVPSTKLKKRDKVAGQHAYSSLIREAGKHRYARTYLAWCDRNGLAPADANNLRVFGQRTARKNPTGFRYTAAAVRYSMVVCRRRYAAPDYLQKADDALTQLLNQKAEEFQQTIAPLQQALITVQQAEQLQQQQNPLSVLPPPGTVNVMPGQPQSPAAQIGMPDPNQPDISGLVQALQPGGGAMGGIAPQGDAPGGGMSGDAGAPPPAAAGGGLPPDLDPSAQKAARRGKGKGVTRPRQAAGVGEQWDRWRKRKNESGEALRGGDVDYEQFRNETGVGDRALKKLKQRNEAPDWEPVNQGVVNNSPQGITVGRRRNACWPGCHENEAHAAKFHSKDKESRRRKATSPLDLGRHSYGDPDNPIPNPVNPYTGGGMFDEGEDLTPRAARRKQAWSGWGPAVAPKTRHVAGWDWDNHLNGYLANKPQHFACECGESFPTPSGFQRCACGRQWNSYVIGTGGNSRQASAEKFIVREVPVRPDVIVANRKMAAQSVPDHVWHAMSPEARERLSNPPKFTPYKPKHVEGIDYETGKPLPRKAVQLVDKHGNIHNLVDPGEVGQGEDPGHPTFKKPPKDWARRGDGGKWTPSTIG